MMMMMIKFSLSVPRIKYLYFANITENLWANMQHMHAEWNDKFCFNQFYLLKFKPSTFSAKLHSGSKLRFLEVDLLL